MNEKNILEYSKMERLKSRNILLALISLSLIIFIIEPLSSLNNDKFDSSKAGDLYDKQCSKCHRKNGKGIKRIYPPLENSDYIKNNTTEELLRGMIFGRSGKIVVIGASYNGVMTTEIDNSLTNYDIALILTFVLQNLNQIDKIVSPKDVESARKAGKLPVK